MDKKVGELNGPWSMAFKFLLLTWPVAVGWAGWISLEVISHSNRITSIETVLASLSP